MARLLADLQFLFVFAEVVGLVAGIAVPLFAADLALELLGWLRILEGVDLFLEILLIGLFAH